MELKARELIKVLLSQENIKQKKLVEMLNNLTGKSYTPSGLSHKIGRGSISYDEVVDIINLLGYEIKIGKKL